MFAEKEVKELLQKINHITDESSQSGSQGQLNDYFENHLEFESYYENYSSSTNEKEDNLNASRGQKRMRLLTDSENDSEERTKWEISNLLLMEQFRTRSK